MEWTGTADAFIDPAKLAAEPGVKKSSVAEGTEWPIGELAGEQKLLGRIDAGGELRPLVTGFVEQGGDLLGSGLIEHEWSCLGVEEEGSGEARRRLHHFGPH